MPKGDLKEFCEAIKRKDFLKAAELVEDISKQLAEQKISSSALRRLIEIVMNLNSTNQIDRVLARSELLATRLSPLSETIASIIFMCDDKELLVLKKLLKALDNFYTYYSGGA